MDDGVIKFCLDWEKKELAPGLVPVSVLQWRNWVARMGWIGVEDGIAYGNLSFRNEYGFVITGSGTGALLKTQNRHYSQVLAWNIEKNIVSCRGDVAASSESLTHAGLYELSPEIRSVLHIHDGAFWAALLESGAPATAKELSYGSVEMAAEMKRIFPTEKLPETGILVMTGHEKGVLAFGPNMNSTVLCLIKRAQTLSCL